MDGYRFYFLGADGHIAGPPAIAEFPSDWVAIEAARALLDQQAIDVWDGKRVVIRLQPKHAPGPPRSAA